MVGYYQIKGWPAGALALSSELPLDKAVSIPIEIAPIDQLLLPGGLLVVDDVSETWHGVEAAFDALTSTHNSRFRVLLRDGRIGIAQKYPPTG